MKTPSAILALGMIVLAPCFSAAQIAVPAVDSINFDSIKSARGNSSDLPGVVGEALRIKYRVKDGRGAEPPEIPPNLTNPQIFDLMTRLVKVARPLANPPIMTGDQMTRLRSGLNSIDRYFVDSIPKERWDEILQAMGDTAQDELPRNRDWDKTIDLMFTKGMALLKEPHSAYMTPADVRELYEGLSGSFDGIGAALSAAKEGPRVDVVYPESGAQSAGLQRGDVIVTVQNVSTAGLPLNEVVRKIRGPAGTSVVLTVLRGGRRLDPIRVNRTKLKVPNAFSKMLAGGIGYVYFSEFNENTDELVFQKIRDLRSQGAQSLVLDIRHNPGGSVPVVASIVSEFLKDGQAIVSFKHQSMLAHKYITDGDGEFSKLPVVVLVDGRSASASEILSGALQDPQRGFTILKSWPYVRFPIFSGEPDGRFTIVGSRTYGKGTEQIVKPEPDNRGLRITENRWYTPNDRNIDAQHDPKNGMEIAGTGGIVPDVIVDVSEEQSAKIIENIMAELFQSQSRIPDSTKDPVLEKAVEILSRR